jgi:exosome complex RNA-binding protein Rrp42 (RNase PH superfamily)
VFVVGLVSTADGSALAKIGSTTMLAAIRMEVMTPSTDSPDEGCIGCYLVVLFSMWFVVLLW